MKQLLYSLHVVHVRGKRGRQVPVLFGDDEDQAIRALIQSRVSVGVEESNVYVFAAPTRGSKKWFRGNDCMNKVLKKIEDIKSPERIGSTELRKYCATVTQVADLTENDLRWLAEHMGHDLDVHREYYRLRDSTIELTKVSRLLLAMDEGNASKIVGKKLSEINVEGTVVQSKFKMHKANLR